jgi:hypothetical protein
MGAKSPTVEWDGDRSHPGANGWGLAATGLISSLIVDNQIVDINRERSELQYHAVAVPHGNRQHPEDDINAPVERLLRPIVEEG